ncbi:MAG: hypothetical protein P2A85_11455 [Microcoleus anatoxicus]|uniref:hypothetical protein n=1 Tax=Microcoleus anatoxicus TaxID=2705319 RepID=UPI00367003AA
MTPKVTIQELALALTAKNHSPTLLNSDFLKYSGIVPADWELARPPVFSPQISQAAFTNGINIVAQSNAITFIESLSTKSQEDVKIPDIIRKYVEALPRTDYQTLSINPRSFITFEAGDENAAREFITSTLLAKGTWSDVGKAPVKAAVNLVYSLEQGELNLSVAEALLQLQDAEPTPAVLFSGSFQYEIAGELEGEKLQHLYKLLENWQPDLEAYREIVNKRFLGQEEVEELMPA